MNLWNRGDRDPDGRRSVTRRQLLFRFAFYVVLFVVLIWWAKS